MANPKNFSKTKPRPPWTSSPDLEVHETPAGRETLAAIASELAPQVRQPMRTVRYGDRVSNAPGAKTPRSVGPLLSSPEISIGQTSIGRETLAAIHEELTAPTASSPAERPELLATVFEMATFVVSGANPSELSSDQARRSFVEQRLLHRLPADNMSAVERIDVTPWTAPNTVIVRVWCKVEDPSR